MNILAREGEWGWVHTMKTGINHSAVYVGAEIHYRKPDSTIVSKTCDEVDAAKGEYGWKVTTGFFTPGRWEAMLEIDLGVTSGTRKLRNPVVFLIGESGST